MAPVFKEQAQTFFIRVVPSGRSTKVLALPIAGLARKFFLDWPRTAVDDCKGVTLDVQEQAPVRKLLLSSSQLGSSRFICASLEPTSTLLFQNTTEHRFDAEQWLNLAKRTPALGLCLGAAHKLLDWNCASKFLGFHSPHLSFESIRSRGWM